MTDTLDDPEVKHQREAAVARMKIALRGLLTEPAGRELIWEWITNLEGSRYDGATWGDEIMEGKRLVQLALREWCLQASPELVMEMVNEHLLRDWTGQQQENGK